MSVKVKVKTDKIGEYLHLPAIALRGLVIFPGSIVHFDVGREKSILAIKEAMNSIYNQTFKDSYNMVGSSNSYDHRAHPTSLDISLRFSLGDSYSNKMAPIVVDLPVSASFYHSQDGVTYSVTMNTTTGLNKIGLVTNLMN